MTIYSITTTDEKNYRHEVGKIIKNETEKGTVLHLHLYMYPNTKFQVNEDKFIKNDVDNSNSRK